MKNLLLAGFGLVFLSSSMFAQEPEKKEQRKDTTRISLKGTEIIIYSSGDESKVVIDENGNSTKKKKNCTTAKDLNYWRGLELGINGYFTDKNFGINNDPDNLHMELNYGRSFMMNFNFAEFNANLIGDKFLFTTGLGFRFNRYAFKNTSTTLSYNDTDVFPVFDSTKSFDKNYLNATYLTAPLYLTLVPGKDPTKSFHMSVGAIVNYRIGSRVKQKYLLNDQKFKDISRGHYHLNPFLVDASVRFGVGDFKAFANYSLTAMFEKDKGPQYYPFSAGVSLSF
jgi:hypothetical protein